MFFFLLINMSSTALYDVNNKKTYTNIRVNDLTIDGELNHRFPLQTSVLPVTSSITTDPIPDITISHKYVGQIVTLEIPAFPINASVGGVPGKIFIENLPVGLVPRADANGVAQIVPVSNNTGVGLEITSGLMEITETAPGSQVGVIEFTADLSGDDFTVNAGEARGLIRGVSISYLPKY